MEGVYQEKQPQCRAETMQGWRLCRIIHKLLLCGQALGLPHLWHWFLCQAQKVQSKEAAHQCTQARWWAARLQQAPISEQMKGHEMLEEATSNATTSFLIWILDPNHRLAIVRTGGGCPLSPNLNSCWWSKDLPIFLFSSLYFFPKPSIKRTGLTVFYFWNLWRLLKPSFTGKKQV